jgi:hypothetical protein
VKNAPVFDDWTLAGGFIQIMSGVHLQQDFGETVRKTLVESTDCSADCDAETSFVCTAYMWMPPSGDCILFDNIDLNLQVFVDHGGINLYDQSCNGGEIIFLL